MHYKIFVLIWDGAITSDRSPSRSSTISKPLVDYWFAHMEHGPYALWIRYHNNKIWQDLGASINAIMQSQLPKLEKRFGKTQGKTALRLEAAFGNWSTKNSNGEGTMRCNRRCWRGCYPSTAIQTWSRGVSKSARHYFIQINLSWLTGFELVTTLFS